MFKFTHECLQVVRGTCQLSQVFWDMCDCVLACSSVFRGTRVFASFWGTCACSQVLRGTHTCLQVFRVTQDYSQVVRGKHKLS